MPNTLRQKTEHLANFADNSVRAISAQSALDLIHTMFPLRSGSTVLVAGVGASLRTICQADVVCDGVADNVEIQSALDARADDDDYGLTSGRTWSETVKLVGAFTLAGPVLIDAYTTVDATEARCVLANATNTDMFRNRHFNGVEGVDAEDPYITWLGGEMDGNKANQTDAAQDPTTGDPICNLLLTRVPYVKVIGLRSHDSEGMGFKLTGRFSGGETTEMHTVMDVMTWNNAKRGISIQNGLRNGIYGPLNSMNDCTDGGASQGAVYIGHSEGLYPSIMVEGSGAHGIFINNVRNVQGNLWQSKGNTRNGLYVLGFVHGAITNANIGRNSVGSTGTYSDVFFSGQDYFPSVGQGYGTSKQFILDGIFGEDISGQASAKAAIEFDDAADNAGTFLTSNESVLIRGIVNMGRRVTTALNGGINASVTTITVTSTTNFSSAGVILIDNERITYTGKTATTFTGCVRGVDATSHLTAATVTEIENYRFILPANTRFGSIVLDVLEQSDVRPAVPEARMTQYGGARRGVLTSEQNNNILKTQQSQVDVDTADTNHTKKLPGFATAGVGYTVTVRKVTGDANTVTVLPQTGERLNGVVDQTRVITVQYGYVYIRCNGVDGWDVISERLT